MSWRASYQNSSHDISFCVLVKGSFLCCERFVFYLQGLDLFGLVWTERVCERCVVSGRFWLVPLRLRFAGWRVLDFHMVAELVCLELSEK